MARQCELCDKIWLIEKVGEVESHMERAHGLAKVWRGRNVRWVPLKEIEGK